MLILFNHPGLASPQAAACRPRRRQFRRIVIHGGGQMAAGDF
jgi:hypothetical protein